MEEEGGALLEDSELSGDVEEVVEMVWWGGGGWVMIEGEGEPVRDEVEEGEFEERVEARIDVEDWGRLVTETGTPVGAGEIVAAFVDGTK